MKKNTKCLWLSHKQKSQKQKQFLQAWQLKCYFAATLLEVKTTEKYFCYHWNWTGSEDKYQKEWWSINKYRHWQFVYYNKLKLATESEATNKHIKIAFIHVSGVKKVWLKNWTSKSSESEFGSLYCWILEKQKEFHLWML